MKNMVILNKQKRMIRMKKAIFSIIISLILVLTATGCSNSSKEKPIKKSALEINPTSKAVNITVNKKENNKPEKIGKVYRYKNNNAKEITNDGIKKDTKDTLIWKGVANKYDNVKDLINVRGRINPSPHIYLIITMFKILSYSMVRTCCCSIHIIRNCYACTFFSCCVKIATF